MSSDDSVTCWINQLKDGDRAIVQRLWEAYMEKLLRLAHHKLRGLPQNVADPEDLAHSVFKSFCRVAEQRRFPKLEDRDDLWQILVRLTRNKAANLWKHHTCAGYDWHKVVSADALGRWAYHCHLLYHMEAGMFREVVVA